MQYNGFRGVQGGQTIHMQYASLPVCLMIEPSKDLPTAIASWLKFYDSLQTKGKQGAGFLVFVLFCFH